MARSTGPKARISRRFNEPILGDNKALQKKNYAPGMHGKGKKRKLSEYAIQLAEKQSIFDVGTVNQRNYQFAYAPLRIRGNSVGLISAALRIRVS